MYFHLPVIWSRCIWGVQFLSLEGGREWSQMSTQWTIIPCPLLNILNSSPAHEAGVSKPTTPLIFPLSLHLCPSSPLPSSPNYHVMNTKLSSISSTRNMWRPGHREVKVGNTITLPIVCLSDWQKLLTSVVVWSISHLAPLIFLWERFFFMEWLKLFLYLQPRDGQKWKIFKAGMVQREIQFLLLRLIDSLTRSHLYFWGVF